MHLVCDKDAFWAPSFRAFLGFQMVGDTGQTQKMLEGLQGIV